MGTCNYNATSNNVKLVLWPRVGCYIWYSEEGHPARPLLLVPNVTLLLYNGPLRCSFNVPTKGLNAGKSVRFF